MHGNGQQTTGGSLVWAELAAMLAPPLLFVALAWPAIRESSATYDEPAHVAAGYTYLSRGDYRLAPDPPLVKQLLAAPLLALAPNVSPETERAYEAARHDLQAHLIFSHRFFFRDNAPHTMLAAARAVSLALGVALIVAIQRRAGPAFGLVGGIVAATLAAVDPNLLAHATLATTDVGFAVVLFLAATLVARTFEAWTPLRVLTAGVAIGAALASKHSALLLVPIVLAYACMRVLDATPWPVAAPFRGRAARTVTTVRQRLVTTTATLVVLSALAWTTVWALYGFRYAAAADGLADLPIASTVASIRKMKVLAEIFGGDTPMPNDADLAARVRDRPAGLDERAIENAARHHVFPEAYLFGLAFATAFNQVRPSYVLGDVMLEGWTWYFPLALAVKTPLGTLAAFAVTLALLIVARVRRWPLPGGAPGREVIVLAIPPLFLLATAMRSNVNIGYRHVLPMLPFLFALTGALPGLLARLVGRRAAMVAVVGLCLLVAGETLAARPYFLSFFNVAAGGSRGGLALLSDSNLDWGQGLPALRRWMTANGVERVSLCYFGTADPAAYGVDALQMTGCTPPNVLSVDGAGSIAPSTGPPVVPGYFAIGATHLQGTYLSSRTRDALGFLADETPVAVLGGAIYVYRLERWGRGGA